MKSQYKKLQDNPPFPGVLIHLFKQKLGSKEWETLHPVMPVYILEHETKTDMFFKKAEKDNWGPEFEIPKTDLHLYEWCLYPEKSETQYKLMYFFLRRPLGVPMFIWHLGFITWIYMFVRLCFVGFY